MGGSALLKISAPSFSGVAIHNSLCPIIMRTTIDRSKAGTGGNLHAYSVHGCFMVCLAAAMAKGKAASRK